MRPRDWGSLHATELQMAFVLHGIGDNIYRLGVFRDLLKEAHHIKKLTLFSPNYFVEAARFFFDKFGLSERVVVHKWDEFETKYDPRIPGFSDRNTGDFTSMRTHLKAYAQAAILNKVDSEGLKGHPFHCWHDWLNEIDVPGLPFPYAVVCTGYTSPTRAFHTGLTNSVLNYLERSKIKPVFLGKKQYFDGAKQYSINFEDGVLYEKGVDLRDKTTLLQAWRIIRDAAVVVGVDNGLMHVAYTTNTPVVGGFTTVDPRLRVPRGRNNVWPVVPPASCRYCQSDWHPMVWTEKNGNETLLKSHDFMDCWHDDFRCVKSLSAASFIEGIKNVTSGEEWL